MHGHLKVYSIIISLRIGHKLTENMQRLLITTTLVEAMNFRDRSMHKMVHQILRLKTMILTCLGKWFKSPCNLLKQRIKKFPRQLSLWDLEVTKLNDFLT